MPGSDTIGGDESLGGDVVNNDSEADASADLTNLVWVALSGGTYRMGSKAGVGRPEEHPAHEVTLSAFATSKTEVTQQQYEGCTAEGCTTPACDWDPAGKPNHPVVCVNWSQSKAFCEWAGARLCTEAEWEYAARSGGKDQTYPWGDATATCDQAVMYDGSGPGCGTGGTWAVCGKTAGNGAQGVCDLAGNVWEWVEDWYGGYPSDAQTNPTGPASGSDRVVRGGSWVISAGYLRAACRDFTFPADDGVNLGFRCCRSLD